MEVKAKVKVKAKVTPNKANSKVVKSQELLVEASTSWSPWICQLKSPSASSE